jgi:hypothetical protein
MRQTRAFFARIIAAVDLAHVRHHQPPSPSAKHLRSLSNLRSRFFFPNSIPRFGNWPSQLQPGAAGLGALKPALDQFDG